MMGAETQGQAPLFPVGLFQFPHVTIDPSVAGDTDSDDESENSNGCTSGDDEESESSGYNHELFDSNDLFSVEEDMFLVRVRCFDPIDSKHEFDLSSKFQEQFGAGKTAEDLEARFQILQNAEFRPLLALYIKAIAQSHYAVRIPGAEAASANSLIVSHDYQPLLQSTRTTCESQLLQMMYDDEKLEAEIPEMITVEITSRNFPKYSRLINKRQFKRCCGAINSLYAKASAGLESCSSKNQAFKLAGLHTPSERLQLTDSVPHYETCIAFNHFEQPIFDRMISFAKDPNVVERLFLQRKQQHEAAEIKRELTQKVSDIFDLQKRRMIDKLEQHRELEFDRVNQSLEYALEQDILHLRRMHETLVKHERAKHDAKFDEQLARLSAHIDAMKRQIIQVQNSLDKDTWTSLDSDVLHTAVQVERIFGSSEFVLRLLVLAEDLDAAPLRRALIQYLGNDGVFPQFATRREFTSKLIAETTILAIIKRAPTADLREIHDLEERFEYHDLISRELHTRKVIFKRFVASLTNDQLRAVARIAAAPTLTPPSVPNSDPVSRAARFIGTTTSTRLQQLKEQERGVLDSEVISQALVAIDFPAVVDDELVRRREFSCVKLNSGAATVDRMVSFSEDDCVVQLETSHRYCTIVATKERRQGESGRWMFEVMVDVFGGDGESMFLGWELPRASLASTVSSPSSHIAPSSFVPGLTAGPDARSYGVTWQSEGGLDLGMLHANGQSRSGVPCFRAGDVVACTINQDDPVIPSLRFFLNGIQVIPPLSTTRVATAIVAASSVSTPSSSAPSVSEGIVCHNPVYRLLPAICMYSSRKKPEMRARFNFRGDFRFPLAGYEPYGAPL